MTVRKVTDQETVEFLARITDQAYFTRGVHVKGTAVLDEHNVQLYLSDNSVVCVNAVRVGQRPSAHIKMISIEQPVNTKQGEQSGR